MQYQHEGNGSEPSAGDIAEIVGVKNKRPDKVLPYMAYLRLFTPGVSGTESMSRKSCFTIGLQTT